MSTGELAATPGPRTAGRRAWALAAAAMFACGWGGNQFTPLLLMYRQQGGYSAVTVDAFLAAYVVGLVPGLLICGPLSDRYGRKPLMAAGTIASLVASGVLCAGTLGQAPIYAGRLLTGVAVGIAMAVGTSWVKELSQAPYDPAADRGTAARRASLSLTGGLALGPGVAGVLAQWGPWPMVLPYAVHIAVAAGGLLALMRAPETRTSGAGAAGASAASTADRTSLWADLRATGAGHRRFLRIIVPMAPWIFGASGIAYAVMPQLVGARLGSWGLAYATLLTVLTLGTGAAVAPLAKRLCARSTARAIVVGMALMTVGMALCAADASLRSPWLALVGAMTLGAAYGIVVVSGLLEIQRIAGPDDLAGLTGVYYALAYVGFLLPPVLAALSAVVPYTLMLGVLAVLALGSLVTVGTGANTPLGTGSSALPGSRTVAGGGPRTGDGEQTAQARVPSEG